MSLTVVQGEQELDLPVEVGTHPKPINLEQRQLLAEPGLTVREFVVRDAIRRRVSHFKSSGVIASYVKPNSAVNSAGLLERTGSKKSMDLRSTVRDGAWISE